MEKFELVNLNKLLYPTPRKRKDDPIHTELTPGDIVRVLIDCPAKGKVGFVVVERNGNYHDYQPSVDKEGIGVGFAEEESTLHPLIKGVVEGLTGQKPIIVDEVRWFDSPSDL